MKNTGGTRKDISSGASTVLVIGDSSTDTQVIEDCLEDSGLEIVVVRELAKDLEIAGSADPALILLDLVMPELAGLETCRKLKADEGLRHVPIVFMIDGDALQNRIDGLRAGADDYIIKPIERVELLSVVKDIIDLVSAQGAVSHGEARLQDLFEAAIDGVLVADAETRKLSMPNRQMCEILGYEQDELCQLRVDDIHPKEALSGVLDDFRKLARGEIKIASDTPLQRRDGSVLYADVSSAPVDIGGRTSLVGVFRDVTERMARDEEGRSHVHFLESLDRINDAIVSSANPEEMLDGILDNVLNIFQCDRAWLLYPCDPDAPTWSVKVERTRPEYPGALSRNEEFELDPVLANYLRKLLETREPSSGVLKPRELGWDLKEKYGVRSHIDMALSPRVGKAWQFGLHQCSYARVWTEDETALFKEIGLRVADGISSMLFLRDLRESEGNYRSMVDNHPIGVAIHRPTGEIIYVNQQVCRILGLESRDSAIGKNVLGFVHPDYVQGVTEGFKGIFEKSEPKPEPAEEVLIRKDGSEVVAEITGAPMMFKGEPTIQVMIADISQRKKAEKALRESESKYRSLVENQPVGVVIHRENGEILYANPELCRILGYPSGDEILGKNVGEFVPPESIGDVNNRINKLIEKYEVQLSIEETLLRKDGSRVVTEIGGLPMKYLGEPSVQLTVVDVTERKEAEETQRKLEAQLLRSQKLEAVGQLAGGVAHDFNNILTAILGHVDLNIVGLRKTLGQSHNAVLAMEEIEKSAMLASSLTRQLLTFSRRDVVQPAVLNLNNIFEGLDRMLQRLITENITLEATLAPHLRPVLADAGRIEQVIVNLVVNAVHAMPDGGQLVVETRNVDIDEAYASTHVGARPGRSVLLAVSDTGHGMDKATQERIFEPFFTTKSMDMGSGLGLSTVHGIVVQTGGHIQVYSEPGEGTTFKVYLPASESSSETSIGEREGSASVGGHETLLLSEDDRAVRELTARVLESAGYRVLVASSGLEAQRVAAEHSHHGTIDLLITDVIMTDMNGRQLSDELGAKLNGLPTLFISGYTSNVIAHHGVLDDDVEFLEKPFSTSGLLSRVRAILDGYKKAPR